MAIDSQTVSVRYSGNNSNETPYAVPFRFIDAEDVAVAVVDDAGAETILTYGADYQLTGAGDPDGGSMTTEDAIPASSTLTIFRAMAALQPYSYEEGQMLRMKTVEANLDYLTLPVQQIQASIPAGQKALAFPTSDNPSATLPTAETRKGTFLYFETEEGDPVVMTQPELVDLLAPDLEGNEGPQGVPGPVGPQGDPAPQATLELNHVPSSGGLSGAGSPLILGSPATIEDLFIIGTAMGEPFFESASGDTTVQFNGTTWDWAIVSGASTYHWFATDGPSAPDGSIFVAEGVGNAGSITATAIAGDVASAVGQLAKVTIGSDITWWKAATASPDPTTWLEESVGVTDAAELTGILSPERIEDESLPIVKTIGLVDALAEKSPLRVEDAIYGTDYGIVPSLSDDVTATANRTALAAVVALASSLKRPLILSGTIYIKGQCQWVGTGIDVQAYGCTIIQKDITQHGIEIQLATEGLKIYGLKITGQGPATHAMAGIYGRIGADAFWGGNIWFRNVWVNNFRTGVSMSGVSNWNTEGLIIQQYRFGFDVGYIQTSNHVALKINIGDSDAASCCFQIADLVTGFYGAMGIYGGEFGNTTARLMNIAGGKVVFENCNFEGFSSDQTINCTTTTIKTISLKNCRMSINYTGTTKAMISANVTGVAGMPYVEYFNVGGWAGNPRQLELWGTPTTTPAVAGEPILCTLTATQGGAVTVESITDHDARGYVTAGIPTAKTGTSFILREPTNTGPDAWRHNPIYKSQDNFLGVVRGSSMLNDMLMRVFGTQQRTASSTSTTTLLTASVPYGALSNDGESVELVAYGTTAANANTKQFKVSFGGVIVDFGALPLNNESWKITATIQRGTFSGGTGYMKICGVLQYSTGQVVKCMESPSATLGSTAFTTLFTVDTPTAASDCIGLAAKLAWTRTISYLT